MNHAHVENKKYPRGDLRFPTWIFEEGGCRKNRSYRRSVTCNNVMNDDLTGIA